MILKAKPEKLKQAKDKVSLKPKPDRHQVKMGKHPAQVKNPAPRAALVQKLESAARAEAAIFKNDLLKALAQQKMPCD